MINLKQETLECLERHNKTIDDIKFIDCEGYTVTNSIEDIFNLMDVEYDNGYGTEEVKGIIIVGDGWWMERHEYDGSEWWAFIEPPKMSTETIEIKSLLYGEG